jgi:site-specific recombinase XerD
MLLYGSGFWLMEALGLRVKDVDLVRREIRVRDTKGGRPRVTVLLEVVVESLRGHLERVKRPH